MTFEEKHRKVLEGIRTEQSHERLEVGLKQCDAFISRNSSVIASVKDVKTAVENRIRELANHD